MGEFGTLKLIDGCDKDSRWLCNKGDISAGANNTITFYGIFIGVLICLDIQYPRAVTDRMAASRAKRKVICIPASMVECCQNGRLGAYEYWNDKYVVIANGAKPANFWAGSFITKGSDTRISCRANKTNLLYTIGFDELDKMKEAEVVTLSD